MKVKKEAWELGTVVIGSFLQEIGSPLIYIPELAPRSIVEEFAVSILQ